MSAQLEEINTDTGEIIESEHRDLMVTRQPDDILKQAHTVALALKQRIENKLKPVRFNGETYLEFEDWQLLANFYGITAKVVETKYVEYGNSKGFEARAVALKINNGLEISGAEAMCLNDEPNWAKKPLFQLKSMAQTRASAKVLRNIFAWIVVLAGYKPTPAEEMTLQTTPQPYYPTSAPESSEPIQVKVNPKQNVAICTFGKNKGVAWVDMTSNQLSWYRDTFIKSINDPSKQSYKTMNEGALQEVLDAMEVK